MTYDDRFKIADDMITHLDTFVSGITDPFISSRYVGFVAVVSVTSYELAIKDIFIDFGLKKHKVLGEFTRKHFERINGRIKPRTIKDEYINRFGEKYVNRFNKKIDNIEKRNLRTSGTSVLSSYGNIILWRNQFTHEGQIPTTVTYVEVKNAYVVGKELIKCLAETMNR